LINWIRVVFAYQTQVNTETNNEDCVDPMNPNRIPSDVSTTA